MAVILKIFIFKLPFLKMLVKIHVTEIELVFPDLGMYRNYCKIHVDSRIICYEINLETYI